MAVRRKALALALTLTCLLIIPVGDAQLTEEDKREAVSTDARLSQMIGKFLLTATGQILIFDANQRVVVNSTFPEIDQLPLKSAIYDTARMAVINGVAYIGGKKGFVYVLKLPIDYLEAVLAGKSPHGGAKAFVETVTENGVVAACYNDATSTLYVVNVHSPSDKSEVLFTAFTDFSNLLPVEGVLYYVQHDLLHRVDTAGAVPVQPLESCGQAWLKKNERYYIIIECENKSIVYIPKEWNGDDKGIMITNGAWKNRNARLKQFFGSPFVFSVKDDTTVILYNSYNDFESTITLSGAKTVVCTWNNGSPTLLNRNEKYDCWKQHLLTDNLTHIKKSSFISHSEGIVPPLNVGDKAVSQETLMFDPTNFLVPAQHQLFLDLHNDIVHPMITDDNVIFHAAIYPVVHGDSSQVKPIDPNDDSEDNPNKVRWPVYVVPAVGGMLLFIIAIILMAYMRKHRKRIWNFFKREPRHPIQTTPSEEDLASDIQVATTEL